MTEQRHSVVSQRMPSPALAVEACVSQSRMHRDTVPNPPRRERDNETDEANLDASGASNSSSDTLSGVKAPALTQDASPVSLNNHSRRSTDRSSSSSSSSSSLLSSSHSNAGPYETPLTAALASQDHSAKLSRPLTEPGYPFPQIPATSDLAERPNASSTRKHSDDLWKHTDDLLGPSNRSASGQSASKPGPSTLSLSKPDASADGDVQHTSLSQATTPTAADMDRRDSQSSSSSSRSVNQQKSTASQSGYPGAVAVKQSSSSNSLAKLSSSSSPVGSSGMASFSPLSPLVQPFSPSANAANLPNKSAAMPKATPLTNASGRLTQPQSSTSIQTFSEGSATAQTVHSAVGHQQRRQATGDSLLEASTTSSSGDTGYFSAYAPTRSANPSSATDIQRSGGLPDLYKRSLVLDHVQPVETGRQRYWSGEEALAMSAATVGTGGDSYNLDPPQLTTHGSWPQAHGNSGSEGLFSYEDPRLGSHTNTYVGPMPSGHSVSHQNAISLAQSGMPSMRGAESFDAGLYGYGPASVSDISTAGGEEICTM